jgi:hypothetical protein
MKVVCLAFVLVMLSSALANESVKDPSTNGTDSSNHTTNETESKHPEGVVLVEIKYEAIKGPFFFTLVVLIAGLSKIGEHAGSTKRARFYQS